FTPFAAGLIIATMLVAIFGVHLDKGFFGQNGGYEFPLTIGAVALGLAFTGPGALSIDALAGIGLAGTGWGLVALGLSLFGAVLPLLTRSLAAAHQPGQELGR